MSGEERRGAASGAEEVVLFALLFFFLQTLTSHLLFTGRQNATNRPVDKDK